MYSTLRVQAGGVTKWKNYSVYKARVQLRNSSRIYVPAEVNVKATVMLSRLINRPGNVTLLICLYLLWHCVLQHFIRQVYLVFPLLLL